MWNNIDLASYLKFIIMIQMSFKCDRKWSNMQDLEGGKFCTDCSKKVLDFTDKSPSEISSIIQNSETSVCGKIKSSHLSINVREKNIKLFLIAIALVFGTNLLAQDTTAQKTDTAIVQVEQQKRVIKGRVLDEETKDPLPFVNIIIEGTKLGTVADFDGNYVLEVPDSSPDTISIIFSLIGYTSSKVEGVTWTKPKELVVNLDLKLSFDMEVLGGLIWEPVLLPDNDPKKQNETKFDKDQIRRMPY